MLRLQDTEYVAALMDETGARIEVDNRWPGYLDRIRSGEDVVNSVLAVLTTFNATSTICGDNYSGKKTGPHSLKQGEVTVVLGGVTLPFDPIGTLDALGDLIVVLKGASLALGLQVDKHLLHRARYFSDEELADTAVIREFMVAVKQEVRDEALTNPDEALLSLRSILALEEAFELLEEGLGVRVVINNHMIIPRAKTVQVKVNPDLPFNPDAAREALINAIIAVKRAGLCLGLPVDNAVLDQIGPSNLSKLDENGEPIYREDGKVMKSDLYFEADFGAVLDAVQFPRTAPHLDPELFPPY